MDCRSALRSTRTSSIRSTRRADPVVGLTCAACHTGELHYGEVRRAGRRRARDDRGRRVPESARTRARLQHDVSVQVSAAMGDSSERVLGPNATDEQKAELKRRVDAFVSAARHQPEVTRRATSTTTRPASCAPMRSRASAIRSLPPTRNIDDNYAVGELRRFAFRRSGTRRGSTGCSTTRRSRIRWRATSAKRWASVRSPSCTGRTRANSKTPSTCAACVRSKICSPVRVRCKGLASPKWPAVFPPLDPQKVAAGAALYRMHCQKCHLPPLPRPRGGARSAGDRQGPSTEALVAEHERQLVHQGDRHSDRLRSAPIRARRRTS